MTDDKLAQAIALINSGDKDPFKTVVITMLLEITGDLKELRDRVEDFETAFPDKDPVSHCNAHKEWIKEAEDKRVVARDARSKLTSGILWSALTGAAIAIWEWFKHEVKK